MQIAPYLGEAYVQSSTGAAGMTAHDQMRAVTATLQCPATREPVKEWDASQGFDGNGCPGTAKSQYRYHVERIEGSYAINDWVGGWDWNFNPAKVGQAANDNLKKSYRQSGCMAPNVPVILDGMWVGVGPLSGTDPVPGKLDGYGWDRNNNSTFESGDWFQNEMERIFTNRHSKTTNLVYGDGHVDKIELKDLWTQRWHRQYVPNYNVSIPLQ
jgi:prepilin-type processing-associated H-X9-DG protein